MTVGMQLKLTFIDYIIKRSNSSGTKVSENV